MPGRAHRTPGGEEHPLLALHGVTKRFGATLALDGVSVAFRGGEVHALVGENGAGKSTLLNIIAGVIRPDPPSQMEVDGHPVNFAHYSPRAAQLLGISIVPQESVLIDAMTVAENIFLGREPRFGPVLKRGEMYARAEALLRRLGASLAPDLPVERLSVAQAQLVVIARALALESRIVAMDEPSAVLAGDELERLFRVIHQLASDGVAVIYVSHRLDEIFDLCDRFTVLKDGRLVETGCVDEIRREELIRMMVGREVSDIFPSRAASQGRVRLRVSHLSVRGKLNDIDLEAREGEILGIAGLMGSGRTTLAKAVFGAIPVSDETRVWVDGVEGPFRSPAEALKAGLAYVPEDRKREGLATRKTVRWNLTLLGLRRILRGPLRLIQPRRERALVQTAVTRLSIHTRPTGDDVMAKLSGGNQQKVVLAKWLEANPRVLILDEPTRGIDVGTKQEIYRLLRELASEGLAIVVISSDLIEILGLADRIVVMREGRIGGTLDGKSATEEAVMRLATASEEVER